MTRIRDLINNKEWRYENLNIERDYEMLSFEDFLDKWASDYEVKE
jgi:hypothetical protein